MKSVWESGEEPASLLGIFMLLLASLSHLVRMGDERLNAVVLCAGALGTEGLPVQHNEALNFALPGLAHQEELHFAVFAFSRAIRPLRLIAQLSLDLVVENIADKAVWVPLRVQLRVCAGRRFLEKSPADTFVRCLWGKRQNKGSGQNNADES